MQYPTYVNLISTLCLFAELPLCTLYIFMCSWKGCRVVPERSTTSVYFCSPIFCYKVRTRKKNKKKKPRLPDLPEMNLQPLYRAMDARRVHARAICTLHSVRQQDTHSAVQRYIITNLPANGSVRVD